MSVTYSGAIDSVYTLFRNAWLLDAGAVVGYIPELRYMRVEKTDLPERTKYWSRLSYTSQFEEHAAIGNRLFEGEILFSQQIFCPKNNADVLNKGRALAEISKGAIRGKSIMGGEGYFRRVTINENSPDANWVQFVTQGYLYYQDAT